MWIDGVGRTRLCGSDWRTGWRRGSEAWIGGLGLGPLTLRPTEGHELGNGAWGDRRWGLVWVGKLGRWNKSAVKELAGELRDEGDEGGHRAREEKKWRKKEQRREAREREREREGNVYLMREEKEV